MSYYKISLIILHIIILKHIGIVFPNKVYY